MILTSPAPAKTGIEMNGCTKRLFVCLSGFYKLPWRIRDPSMKMGQQHSWQGCILLSFCFLSVINDSWSFPCLLTVCQIMSKGVVAVLGPSASPASNSIISNICGEKEVSAGIGSLLSSVQHTKAQIILPSNHSYHYCNDRSVQRHALKMIPNHS